MQMYVNHYFFIFISGVFVAVIFNVSCNLLHCCWVLLLVFCWVCFLVFLGMESNCWGIFGFVCLGFFVCWLVVFVVVGFVGFLIFF